MKYFGGIPKHLYEQRSWANANKRSVLEQAGDVLGCNRLRLEADGNKLWIRDRWVPATVNDIMRAANRVLASQGRLQITNNPAWVIHYGE